MACGRPTFRNGRTDVPGWFEKRFVEQAEKPHTDCEVCGRRMWLPACQVHRYKTCGEACALARRQAAKAARMRRCETCHAEFCPRPGQIAAGQGKYCSVACAEPARALGRTPEVAAKRGAAHKAAFAAGLWTPVRGADHPSWKGGKLAHLARIDKAARAAARRAYLKANPEKAREWARRRRGAMSRLPIGTVKKLGVMQRWRCAVCGCSVKGAFHVDHILPLALGGEHAPQNLQLLCPTCNVRKSAKHPVDFMRERGFLL